MRARLIGCAGLALPIVLAAVPTASGQILNPRVTISGVGSFVKAQRTFVLGGETFMTEFANGGKGKAGLRWT